MPPLVTVQQKFTKTRFAVHAVYCTSCVRVVYELCTRLPVANKYGRQRHIWTRWLPQHVCACT